MRNSSKKLQNFTHFTFLKADDNRLTMEALTIDKHDDMLQPEPDYSSEINAGELSQLIRADF